MRLKGKVALVVGGASGIGRATAILFGQEGAKVVIGDQDEAGSEEAASETRDRGSQATVSVGDITQDGVAKSMVQTAVENYGRLDILVNSAGVIPQNAFSTKTPRDEVWDRVIEVNLKGTYLVSRQAVPEMAKSGGGSIINLASIMGLVGFPPGMRGGWTPYNPSKGGVVLFTRSLAVEVAKDNIRVNCICPGFVFTPMIESLTSDPETLQSLMDKHPLGRLGQPEEIATVALFLASDESSFMTGSSVVADGGYTAV